MSTPTDRTASQDDELQRLQQRITELERERAQRQLETGSIVQAADQHYRLLFEHTPSMYFALLPDGTVLSVNQYGAEYLGYVPEELIGRSILSVFDRADHPTVLSQLTTCANNPSRIFEWEIGKVRKNGSPLWVKERAQTVADGTGRLMILVVCEDISAQHRAEAQRKHAEESLRELTIALSRAMPGIARLDLDGRYTAVNEYYAAELGYGPAELIGQSWQPTVHPEDHTRAEQAYRHMLRTGQAEFEALGVKKDSTHFHKHVFMVRINDAAGRAIGHHCFMRNISRRKQADQELHMIKERLQHLITASPAIIYACKPCGDYGATYISDNVMEQLGYRPQEFIEDSGFWADHLHPEDRARVFAEMSNLFRDGRHESDYRFRHRNGTYRWMHDRLILVRDNAGNPLEIVGSWIDVTTRRYAEEAQRESERAIRALQEATSTPGLSLHERIQTVLALGCRRFNLPIGALTKVQDEMLEFTHVWPSDATFFVGMRAPQCDTYCGTTFRMDAPLCFEHAGASEWRAHPAYGKLGLECYIGTRLVGEDRAHGTICFFGPDPYPGSFSQADKDFLLLIARWISGELDRHEADQALHEQESLLRSVIETATDAIFMKGSDGRYRFINSAGASVIGKSPSQIVGKTDAELFPSETANRIIADDRAVLSGTGQRRFEVAIPAEDQPRSFYSIKTPHKDQQGHIVGLVGVARDMTDIKRAESALRLTQFAVDHAGDLIFWIDRDARFRYVNDAAAERLGYSREELDRMTVADIDTGYQRENWSAHWENLRRHKRLRFEASHRTKSGEIYPTEVVANFVEFERQEYMFAFVRDISERKKAERALKESEERFGKAFRSSPYPIGITELETGACVDINDAALGVFGYTREELIGQTTFTLGIWPEPELRRQFIERVKADGSVRNIEVTLRAKNGALRHFLASSELIVLDGKQCLVTIGNDITERKQAEDALRKSNTFLRQVIDIDPNFIFAKDRDGRFTLVNQAIADAYGTTVEGLIGKTDADFNANRKEVEYFRKMDLEVMDTLSERFIPEEAITDATGKTRWLQTVKRPIFDEDGRATQVLGAATDITERKQAEEQRERLSRDLHDNLLQSLYAIGMQLEASRLASGLSAKQSKTYVGQAIAQLNHLVHDVRDFITSLKQRSATLRDLGQALHHVVASMSFAKSSAPQLELEPSAVAAIRPDHADHILNIAREALSNSLRHAHASSRWVCLCRVGSAIRLVIEDDGRGFTPAQHHRQGHGLSHMAERAKLIGARFHVESAPGRGTRVTVDVPITGGADHA